MCIYVYTPFRYVAVRKNNNNNNNKKTCLPCKSQMYNIQLDSGVSRLQKHGSMMWYLFNFDTWYKGSKKVHLSG